MLGRMMSSAQRAAIAIKSGMKAAGNVRGINKVRRVGKAVGSHVSRNSDVYTAGTVGAAAVGITAANATYGYKKNRKLAKSLGANEQQMKSAGLSGIMGGHTAHTAMQRGVRRAMTGKTRSGGGVNFLIGGLPGVSAGRLGYVLAKGKKKNN